MGESVVGGDLELFGTLVDAARTGDIDRSVR